MLKHKNGSSLTIHNGNPIPQDCRTWHEESGVRIIMREGKLQPGCTMPKLPPPQESPYVPWDMRIIGNWVFAKVK